MPKNSKTKTDKFRFQVNRIRQTSSLNIPRAEDEEPVEIEFGRNALKDLIKKRQFALTQVYRALDQVKTDLDDFFPAVPAVLPDRIHGQLLNPDGTPARMLAVEADEPEYSSEEGQEADRIAWKRPRAITDARGNFTLPLPTAPIPKKGLALSIRGGNAHTIIQLRAVDLADKKLGTQLLDTTLRPMPKSVAESLKDIIPISEDDVDDNPHDFADPGPVVILGEEDCARSFRSNSGVVDRFRYSMLIRLTEPQVSPKQPVFIEIKVNEAVDDRFKPVAMLDPTRSIRGYLDPAIVSGAIGGAGIWRFVDRLPIDQPIKVSDFHENVEVNPEQVPKASTLGLGYILQMHQTWIPAGLSLGDLLYSLPLAPGEEQRIAVHEHTQRLSVRDAESLSMREAQEFQESADTSTLATFESSLAEAVSGGSEMEAASNVWGVGAAGGVGGFAEVLFGVGAAAGYGSSSSSGNASSWQNASRDFVSEASQKFHSQLNRTANAMRRSTRTGVRLATGSDREQITTKLIANRNHCHALTVQYWEVLRHYAVSSSIDNVQLVCFVPLELIQFLPQDQPQTLPTGTYERDELLTRYQMVIRYYDVLASRLRHRPDYLHGLELLRDFAANPTATVQASSGRAQEIFSFSVRGTFLPFEDVYVSLVTKSGGRVGPVRLSGPTAEVTEGEFSSRESLLQYLRERRHAEAGGQRTANLVLPSYIARSDVVRFELTRQFRSFSYRRDFLAPDFDDASIRDAILDQLTITLSANELERELGGPFVWDVKATIQGSGETYLDAFSGRSQAEQMSTRLPMPTMRIPPILSFTDLLRIESVFQHVVRNTVTYSKAIWMSLTSEERAIMLEPFTIGFPTEGFAAASEEVPLLNCVANQVLGYFGNCMIMPFHIPPQLAQRLQVTSRDFQDALLKFHRQAFAPPRSSVTLPTHGMLGEAVLGTCNACEKIDLTRFWNWKDSPIEKAEEPGAAQAQFKGLELASQGSSLSAPANLVPTQPVNLVNIGTGENKPASSSDLLEQMMKQLPTPTTFTDITGQAKLAEALKDTLAKAETARKDSVEAAKGLAEKALGELPKALSAAKGISDAEKKEQAEAGKAQAEALAKQKAEGLDKLSNSASPFINTASALADQAAANSWAKDLIKSLFGDIPLTPADTALLFDKYKFDDTNDSAKQGKIAMLTALGLPVPNP